MHAHAHAHAGTCTCTSRHALNFTSHTNVIQALMTAINWIRYLRRINDHANPASRPLLLPVRQACTFLACVEIEMHAALAAFSCSLLGSSAQFYACVHVQVWSFDLGQWQYVRFTSRPLHFSGNITYRDAASIKTERVSTHGMMVLERAGQVRD